MSINGISGGAVNGYFYAAATPEKPEQDDEPSSTSSASSTRTDRERDKLRSAQSALETIKQYNKPSDRDAERKARAKQKIAALKARLQMLQMIHPVSTRALAQLARELKAAMKEFGGASGTDGSSTSTQGDGVIAEAGLTSSQNTAGDLNGGNLTADASTVDGDGTSPDASPSAGDSGAKSDAESKAGDAEAKDDGTKAAVYRRMAQQALSRSAEQAGKGEQNRSDKEFLTDVRNLAARIKALAREAAKEGLRGRHDAEEAESAATDAAREAQSAGQELGAASLSVMA